MPCNKSTSTRGRLLLLFAYFSDDLPKTKLKMSVADSLKKALVKLKEQEKDKPAKSDGK